MTVLDREWNDLKRYENRLFSENRTRRIRECVMGPIFLVMAFVFSYLAHVSLLVPYNQREVAKGLIPIPPLWTLFDSWTEGDAMGVFSLSLVGVLILCTVGTLIAALLRIFTKNLKGKAPSLCPETKSLETAIDWAESLNRHHKKKKSLLFLLFLIFLVWIGAVTVGSCLLCENGTNSSEAIQLNLFLAAFEALGYGAALLSWRRYTAFSKYEALSPDVFDLILESLTKEKEKQDQFNQIVSLYLEGKRDQVREHLKAFKGRKSGDINAIKVLCSEKSGDTEKSVREAYNALWKAKDLGFVNDRIRREVDDTLDTLTAAVKELAREDILAAYQSFLTGNTDRIIHDCDQHVSYGHPDAVVMQILGKINSEHWNKPERYEDWLKSLKTAKRRGLCDETAQVADMLIPKLETQIRTNKEMEKEEKKRRRREADALSPSYQPSESLSSWAEPSGWYDFRTGEPLYLVDGKIVNGKNEEVSSAWWD